MSGKSEALRQIFMINKEWYQRRAIGISHNNGFIMINVCCAFNPVKPICFHENVPVDIYGKIT